MYCCNVLLKQCIAMCQFKTEFCDSFFFKHFPSLDSLPADIFHSEPIQLRSSICPSFVPFVSVAKKYEALLVSVAYTCLSPLTDKASFISARRFPQKMHLFTGLKKSPVKQQRTLFAFSYSHSVRLHTVSSETSEPLIIAPMPHTKVYAFEILLFRLG